MLSQKIFEDRGLRLALKAFPAMLDQAIESEEQCNCPKTLFKLSARTDHLVGHKTLSPGE